jgi:hypothetical protein
MASGGSAGFNGLEPRGSGAMTKNLVLHSAGDIPATDNLRLDNILMNGLKIRPSVPCCQIGGGKKCANSHLCNRFQFKKAFFKAFFILDWRDLDAERPRANESNATFGTHGTSDHNDNGASFLGDVKVARHSVRAVVCLAKPGAHGVTRPTCRPICQCGLQ